MRATAAIVHSRGFLFAATLGLSFLAHTATVQAEEQILKFKLVVQHIGTPSELPEIGGHKVSAGEHMGVATFEDGRIAYKRFVSVSDGMTDAGTYKGYSTYTFQDGDSLTLSYTGGWDANSDRGDYQLISGTGKFKGATGTGSFKAVDEPWNEANMYEGELRLTLATQ
jgi:hypothetical protein